MNQTRKKGWQKAGPGRTKGEETVRIRIPVSVAVVLPWVRVNVERVKGMMEEK